ncbi:GatB/YqeY domain-containing protein [Dasania sp. GY-MA-18]|uniref:GatB/YqeY domain-containing protein n=1 Tax=Dasania phycosphaerae TaxID=2950436 RepID=A0A9J6RJV0_9GAMM|nr:MULTISPECIES: GatB/YqeY domain-containing protein [Dasania]MCR8922327.1 GatB/YqeY domain-containing protein [Dasania sp. GY-MA-18]MCZ0864755.1 GatB/YqeY domain-containing protein [Dasania phycosphaerae]MCZ0868483.1 GatB/YqeY domain-containing protein [Dasania phycosphaerae]
MTEQTLKARIKDEMKAAMKAKAKQRLVTIRAIQAEIKRIEVDERIEVDDARLLAVLDKMCKQRRDSIQQYTDGGRADLAEVEQAEMLIIQEFLPAQLSEAEIQALITDAIASTGAAGMQDMGKVMGVLKPKLQGRADMAAVSKLIKASL